MMMLAKTRIIKKRKTIKKKRKINKADKNYLKKIVELQKIEKELAHSTKPDWQEIKECSE
jgi:hypothetical protein